MTNKEKINHNQDEKLSAIERLQRVPYDNYIVNRILAHYEHSRVYGDGLGLDDCLVNAIEALVKHNQELTDQLIEAKMKRPMQYILPKDTKIIG